MAGQGNSGITAILVVSALGVAAVVAVGVRFAVGGAITALFGKTPDKNSESDTAPVKGGSRRTLRKYRSRNRTRKVY